MTQGKNFKRQIRDRMERTSESYSTARAILEKQSSNEPPGPFDDIRIASVPGAHVAAIRTEPTNGSTIEIRGVIGLAFDELNAVLKREGVERIGRPHIFYERVEQTPGVIAFAARTIDDSVTTLPEPIEIRDLLPIERAATVTRVGELGVVFEQNATDLREWAFRMGCRVVGFGRDVIGPLSEDGRLREATLSWEITETKMPEHLPGVPRGPTDRNFSPNPGSAVMRMLAMRRHEDESFFMTSVKVRRRKAFPDYGFELQALEYKTMEGMHVLERIIVERSEVGSWEARQIGVGMKRDTDGAGRLWVNLGAEWNDKFFNAGGATEGPRASEVALARFTFADGHVLEDSPENDYVLLHRRPGVTFPATVELFAKNGELMSSYVEFEGLQ